MYTRTKSWGTGSAIYLPGCFKQYEINFVTLTKRDLLKRIVNFSHQPKVSTHKAIEECSWRFLDWTNYEIPFHNPLSLLWKQPISTYSCFDDGETNRSLNYVFFVFSKRPVNGLHSRYFFGPSKTNKSCPTFYIPLLPHSCHWESCLHVWQSSAMGISSWCIIIQETRRCLRFTCLKDKSLEWLFSMLFVSISARLF